jgi:hypothetical protein
VDLSRPVISGCEADGLDHVVEAADVERSYSGPSGLIKSWLVGAVGRVA